MSQPSNKIGNYGGGFQNAMTGSGSQYNNNGHNNGQSIQNIYNNNTYQSLPNDHHVDDTTNLRDNFLRSLWFAGIQDRFCNIEPAYKGTCDWLFKTYDFEKWEHRVDLPGNNGVLWIKGKPGAGKSTLMKHTLDYCKTMWGTDRLASYFFNARGGILEKSPIGMLRSLVYQLIKHDDAIYGFFSDSFQEKRWTGRVESWVWNQPELEEFLRTTIKRQSQDSKPLVLLVDALDECNKDDVRLVVGFLETLSNSAVQGGVDLRICLSSRHYPHVSMKSLELKIELRREHERDIATYIHNNLRTKDCYIQAQVQNKANGTFMWVTIVVAILNKAYDDGQTEAMQQALERVPKKLDEMFHTLLTADDSMRSETILLFQWVLLSRRPLRAEELYSAVTGNRPPGNEIVSRYINSVSKGLVEIRQGYISSSVQFIHLSVNDFLFRNQRLQTMDPMLGEEPISASHGRLWDRCWTYMKLFTAQSTDREKRDELYAEHPFLRYASDYIFHHAERALPELQQQPIKRWLREQDESIGWWKDCHILESSDGCGMFLSENNDGLLYTLSLCCCTNLAREVLDHGADINALGGEYGNALQAAVYRENEEMIELLLDHSADVNVQGGKYGNALQIAAWKGNEKIVRLLLDYSADVNVQGGQYGNALQAAAWRGNEKIVGLLLDHSADVNVQGGQYGNALKAAMASGNEKIVKMLRAKVPIVRTLQG